MPGRARQGVIRKWLAAQHPKTMTHLEYVANRLEEGVFLEDIAREIKADTAWDIPQHAIRRLLIDEFGKPEVLAAFEEARRIAADQHAADGWTILNEAPEIREALDKAHRKAEFKKWLAATGNRDRYSTAAQTNIQVNNITPAQQHLDALRQRVVPTQVATPVISESPPVRALPEPADVIVESD